MLGKTEDGVTENMSVFKHFSFHLVECVELPKIGRSTYPVLEETTQSMIMHYGPMNEPIFSFCPKARLLHLLNTNDHIIPKTLDVISISSIFSKSGPK